MAFEKLYDYADWLEKEYIRTDNLIYIEALVQYHETVLATAKFRHQRQHCKDLIYKLNPAFAEGYFGKNRP